MGDRKPHNSQQRTLVESVKHVSGRYGGFCFGGQQPDGVTVHKPLPIGTTFPNGAQAAILLTFDVEGTFGNGVGDEQQEVNNYNLICRHLADNHVTATFFVLGQMIEKYGSEFIEWMLEADCEVASHGYWHDLNQHYGGEKVYAGHYGSKENLEQI